MLSLCVCVCVSVYANRNLSKLLLQRSHSAGFEQLNVSGCNRKALATWSHNHLFIPTFHVEEKLFNAACKPGQRLYSHHASVCLILTGSNPRSVAAEKGAGRVGVNGTGRSARAPLPSVTYHAVVNKIKDPYSRRLFFILFFSMCVFKQIKSCINFSNGFLDKVKYTFHKGFNLHHAL